MTDSSARGKWHDRTIAKVAGAVVIAVIAALATTFVNVRFAPDPSALSIQAAEVSAVADHALDVIKKLVSESSGAAAGQAGEAQRAVEDLKLASVGFQSAFARMNVNTETREAARAFLADYYIAVGQAIQLGPDRIPFAVTQNLSDGMSVYTVFGGSEAYMRPGQQVTSGSGANECRVAYLGESSPGVLAISVKCGQEKTG